MSSQVFPTNTDPKSPSFALERTVLMGLMSKVTEDHWSITPCLIDQTSFSFLSTNQIQAHCITRELGIERDRGMGERPPPFLPLGSLKYLSLAWHCQGLGIDESGASWYTCLAMESCCFVVELKKGSYRRCSSPVGNYFLMAKTPTSPDIYT